MPATQQSLRAAGIWLHWFSVFLSEQPSTLLVPKDDPAVIAANLIRRQVARRLWSAARDKRRRAVELPRGEAGELVSSCEAAVFRGILVPASTWMLAMALQDALSRKPGPQKLRGRRMAIALSSADVDPAHKSRLRKRKAVDDWLEFIETTGQTLLTAPSFEEWQAFQRRRH